MPPVPKVNVFCDARWGARELVRASATLVAMADAIGVSRRWIQHAGTWREHFDICKSKRALAVKRGAIETTWRHYGEFKAKARVTG